MPKHEQDIVVVDDDASMSQAIGRLLKAAGLHAVTFPSAGITKVQVATQRGARQNATENPNGTKQRHE